MSKLNGTAVEHSRRRPSLDSLTVLRFFAAMAVVISHFAENRIVPVSERLIYVLDGGRTAVSLFFVLSGFVLAYNYPNLHGRVQRRNFYVARIARIYPMVLLSLLLGAIGTLYAWNRPGILLDWYSLKSPDVRTLLVALCSQISMTTGWFPFASINQPWNGPAWSISCEVFFYALFPLLILWIGSWSRRSVLAVCGAIWLIQGLWIATLTEYLPYNRSGFLIAQFPFTHLVEFVFGIAAWRIWSGAALGWKCRAASLIVTLSLLSALAFSAPFRPVYWLMSPLFAVLVGLIACGTKARSWRRCRILLLGEASYSLYLIHVPLIRVYQMMGVPRGYWGYVAIVATIVLSVVLYKWCETPSRRFVRSHFGKVESGGQVAQSNTDRASRVVA
ncbi:acyltransferase family protein [Pseudonocardia sp. Cha107L01]|uniref:acyltransferase family protein n=1 Tax=Pseudonocardia sp. Cha107L01 TaxID=3457576 RepID=UPI00403ED244